MKKLLTVASVVGILLSAEAYAKTEGSYLGFFGNASEMEIKEGTRVGSAEEETDNFGLSVNYQYLWNISRWSMGVDFFYDWLNAEADTRAIGNMKDSVSLEHRVGVQGNFGYDFLEKWNVYVGIGYAMVDYNASFGATTTTYSTKEDDQEYDFIFALGTKINVREDWDIDAEYNYQEIDVNGPNYSNGTPAVYDVDLHFIKVGMSYRF